MTDDELLDLMHSVFIKNETTSNESISFDEFYTVISGYYSKREGQNWDVDVIVELIYEYLFVVGILCFITELDRSIEFFTWLVIKTIH